jgi:hypothetical protein
MSQAPFASADNRDPLTTTGLANLLTLIATRWQPLYPRVKRFERDTEQLNKDVRTLGERFGAFRAAVDSGDLEALLSMVPEPVSPPVPEKKDILALHARQFAATRAAGRH